MFVVNNCIFYCSVSHASPGDNRECYEDESAGDPVSEGSQDALHAAAPHL